MARKKKKKANEPGAAWLVTFTDMMTLMLTFFVLLVSMATMDERRRLIVLGSLIGTFGFSEGGYDARSIENSRVTVDPGPMENIEDLAPLRDMLWEDREKDINFESNKYVQIISINDRVLFEPGKATLLPEGMTIINRMLPVLLEIDYPLLIGGHTSTLRQEMGKDFDVRLLEQPRDPSWELSLHRVMAVYSYLISRGMDPQHLLVEAFGRFNPKFTSRTEEGRRRNSRVDIVLDKRNRTFIETLERWADKGRNENGLFNYKNFLFNINPNKGQED